MQNCTQCNAPLKFVKAGISKNNKAYPAFWGCSARCGAKGIPAEPRQTQEMPPTSDLNAKAGELLISERLDAIQDQLNTIANYLKAKLG